MQLSALLPLLPLAAALPQSRGTVEARAVEVETRNSTQDECYAAYGNCCDPTKGKGPYNEAINLEIVACIPGRVRCTKALDECLENATEKRSVEEAPVETRNIKGYECYDAHANCCYPFEQGTYSEGRNLMIMACPGGRARCGEVFDECMANQTEKRSVEEAPVEARAVDNCKTNYVDCSHNCPIGVFDEFVGAFKGPCHSKCYEDYEQCTANQTEKRSVKEAPLEARYVEDACDLQFDKCCLIPSNLGNEMRNGLAVHCPLQCYNSLKECKATQAEKRSVEARDNGSEATTACYGKLASCKRKGTPVAECYSNLSRCVQDVYQKFFG